MRPKCKAEGLVEDPTWRHCMRNCPINPDLTRRDDAPYWAAALVLAIRAGDGRRADLARRQLRRLGYPLALVRVRRRPKGVAGGR